MAKKETIEVLVEGGQASGGPPLGPALGPTGINVADVVNAINEKTADYAGMKVPVSVIIDASSKTYDIEIGSPPTSALIKKELGIEKGTGDGRPVADLSYNQLVKITNMKTDQLLGADQTAKLKEVIGTCQSLGVTIEGRTAKHAYSALEEGTLDKEMSEEERRIQEEEERRREADLEEKHKDEGAEEETPEEAAEGEEKPAEEGEGGEAPGEEAAGEGKKDEEKK